MGGCRRARTGATPAQYSPTGPTGREAASDGHSRRTGVGQRPIRRRPGGRAPPGRRASRTSVWLTPVGGSRPGGGQLGSRGGRHALTSSARQARRSRCRAIRRVQASTLSSTPSPASRASHGGRRPSGHPPTPNGLAAPRACDRQASTTGRTSRWGTTSAPLARSTMPS